METDPRLLLLIPASSYRAEDFLRAASRLNIAATVGSDHRQVLARLAPTGSLHVDFSELAQGLATIREFAGIHPLSAIVGTDDRSLELAAAASRELQLPGNTPDAVRAASDKLLFREITAAAGIPSPQFALVRSGDEAFDAARRIGFPCVLKPRSLGGSQGVIRIDDEQACRHSTRRILTLLDRLYPAQHPHRDCLLLESYLPGREYAIDALLVDGELQTLAIFDKPEPMHGPFFEETLFITPSRASPQVLDSMLATVQKATRALGLHSGPIHAELRIEDSGEHDTPTPMLLEIAPRSIGGRCSAALDFDAGLTLEDVILQAALGRTQARTPSRAASGVMMIPIPTSGILHSIKGIEQAAAVTGITQLTMTIGPGEHVQTLPEGNRYLGFIFAAGDHPQEVEHALRNAHRHLAVHIESVESPV